MEESLLLRLRSSRRRLRPMSPHGRYALPLGASVALCFLLAACAAKPPQPVLHPPSALSAKLIFENYLQAGYPEQDIFVESFNGSRTVVRMEPVLANHPEKTAFNFLRQAYGAAEAVPHDLLKSGKNPLGPFPKGRRLGQKFITWIDAKAEGEYQVQNDIATVTI